MFLASVLVSAFVLLTSNIWISEVHGAYELYQSERISDDSSEIVSYVCLMYHMIGEIDMITSGNDHHKKPVLKPSYQLLPYCMRDVVLHGNILNSFTFEQMRLKGLNGSVLASWSAQMDSVERYQEYLENPQNNASGERYYVCQSQWFGQYCQYTFDIDIDVSFDQLVKTTFINKQLTRGTPGPLKITNLTCYNEFRCDRGPGSVACLDWREVCDGMVDCLNGGPDEIGCFELEVNECGENEYRCHDGRQCIPEQFFHDDIFSSDCLDSSDENLLNAKMYKTEDMNTNCYRDPAFRCEEGERRFHYQYVTCGDGQRAFPHFIGNISFPPFGCRNERNSDLLFSLYSRERNIHVSDECWLHLFCMVNNLFDNTCDTVCPFGQETCSIRLDSKCSKDKLVFPSDPVLDGHIRFAYATDRVNQYKIRHLSFIPPVPEFICFNKQRWPFLNVTLVIEGLNCTSVAAMGIADIGEIFIKLSRISLPVDQTGNDTHCRHPSLFQCPGTPKCISKHRLIDGHVDCFGEFDELYNDSCSLNDRRYRFQCTSMANKCLAPVSVTNAIQQCLPGGEDEVSQSYDYKKEFSFYVLCNGHEDTNAEIIEGIKETDETNCEQWPCDNVYTRCDGAWNCPDGLDERYCGEPWCPFDRHPCVSVENHSLICLPLNRLDDKTIDCLGGTDERLFCQTRPDSDLDLLARFHCQNSTECFYSYELCPRLLSGRCGNNISINNCDHIEPIIESMTDKAKTDPIYRNFRLQRAFNNNSFLAFSTIDHPLHSAMSSALATFSRQEKRIQAYLSIGYYRAWLCNRGILIYVGIDKTENCLCPPSYYGDRCQYQNQRVSLTLHFRYSCAPDCRRVFAMVITLFDDQNTIQSREQRLYVPTRACGNKSNIYLLYRSRPKNRSAKYYIRVDAYSKIDLSHYTSWILPVPFLFLPVNRIATQLTLPPSKDYSSSHCVVNCGNHGRCIRASNTGEMFCLCDPGWHGVLCSTAFKCRCSSDSLCLDPSACLCSLHKRGSRCYLNSTCQSNPCRNAGLCVPNNDQLFEDQFTCVCLDGFFGSQCELLSTRISISIASDMLIPQSLLAHFITVREKDDPLHTTAIRKIPVDRDGVSLYMELPFHLIFIQIHNELYLGLEQAEYINAAPKSIVVSAGKRCPHIGELFNVSIRSYPLLRRVKYFHLLCQYSSTLNCFRDDQASLLCICTRNQQANCFTYDFSKIYECQGNSGCENGGQCYQGEPCPTSVVCICPDCYHGARCQFNSKGFGLSLDAILGYHIRRQTDITRQSSPVKLSIVITSIILFFGIVSGICTTLTFQKRSLRDVGCGYYLLAASINSIFTMLCFAYKFLSLLLFQTTLVTHRKSQNVHCHLLDFLLRAFPAIGDWLTAAVAIERAVTVIKGVNFDGRKSQYLAPRIIGLIIMFIIFTFIHDPLYRELVDDLQEERTWCIVRYSFELELYNSVINLFHFFAPFLINLCSAIVIIITVARMRFTVQNKTSYKEHLKSQLRCHKHLLISSVVLVLLAVPRIIISFISGCMKPGRDPWMFLAGYFIPFIPPTLIFLIFVLPSEVYRKHFYETVKKMRSYLSNYFNANKM